eukprot:1164963-Rhodomonas_salina.1
MGCVWCGVDSVPLLFPNTNMPMRDKIHDFVVKYETVNDARNMVNAFHIWDQVLNAETDGPEREADVIYHLFVLLAHCLAFREGRSLDDADKRLFRSLDRVYHMLKVQNPTFATPD